MNYFEITGLDEGRPIKPYVVATNDRVPSVCLDERYDDSVRYYEPISKEQYIAARRRARNEENA